MIRYLDENYFKRWFIHDYESRKEQILQEKREIKTVDLQTIYEKAFSDISDEPRDGDFHDLHHDHNLAQSETHNQAFQQERRQFDTPTPKQ